jgi:hydroxymethylglutaryl-CoA lyase
MEQSLATVYELLNICDRSQKLAVVYLSMAFGNPYGDDWNNEIAEHWTNELVKIGVKIISLADTTGVSTPDKIKHLFPHLQSQFPEIELGVHLHSTPALSHEKLEAAWNSGCRRFDSALRGYGGCPMASDSLTGNIATEGLISFLEASDESTGLDMNRWADALQFSSRIFN